MTDEQGREEYAAVAEALERALRDTGQWTDERPPPFDPADAAPFGGGVMPFTHWLQWVLLERLRGVAAGTEEPPGSSQVAAYAVRELDGQVDLDAVVGVLHDIDALVNRAGGA
jgi:uncharacterized protein YqcC (DUF446 family)